MRHRDCEVFIQSEGERLEEHNVLVRDNVIECHIASISRKVFEILFSKNSNRDLGLKITIDGQDFPRPCLNRFSDTVPLVWLDAARNTRPLMFSEITVTDDENAVRDPAHVVNLGTIQVVVVRAVFRGTVFDLPSRDVDAPNSSIGPLHETIKKGGLHCVTLGAVRKLKCEEEWADVKMIDRWGTPYIIFKFHDRPYAILQAQGIIESAVYQRLEDPGQRAPSPEHPHTGTRRGREDGPSQIDRQMKRPRTDGDPSRPPAPPLDDAPHTSGAEEVKPVVAKEESDEGDEVEEIEAQMQAMRQKLDEAKARRARGSQLRVKKESSPIHVGRFHGGTIDLTSD